MKMLCRLCFKQVLRGQLDACLRQAAWRCINNVDRQALLGLSTKRKLFSSSSLSLFCNAPNSSNGSIKTPDEDRINPAEWKKPFQLPEPGLNWQLLLAEENESTIETNTDHRKGIGDIQKVKALWTQYSLEKEIERKEKLRRECVAEALDIPNMSHPDTVVGDESQAVQVELNGENKKFDLEPRNISEIGSFGLRMLREENLTFATGSKTYYLEADLARLERALVAYTLDHLVEKGFELVSVPDLLYAGVIDSCGFKTTSDRSQVYHLHPDCLDGACMAGTAEMSLAGYFMNEVIPVEELPKKIVAASRCYRAEAAENAAEKGLYRVHHFTKVEMFGLTACEDGEESNKFLHELLAIEHELFKSLGLHFRILDMPTQELGAPAYRKYDVEAWMYGKKIWGEISSCSNCTDFQSRRLNIKYPSPSSGQLEYVHTLNGTACAVPRIITTIVEQNQQPRKTVELPTVLHPYMDGQTHLQGTGKRSTSTYIKTLRKV